MTRMITLTCRACGIQWNEPVQKKGEFFLGDWWWQVQLRRCDTCREGFESQYTVKVHWPAMRPVVDTAYRRISESATAGLNAHKSTDVDSDWASRLRREISGAAAELAFASLINIPWDMSSGTFKTRADVADADTGNSHHLWEIRSTEHRAGHLLVRDDDPGDRNYVLVVALPEDVPTFLIVGYMRGYDARKPKWVTEAHGRRPVWRVPPGELMPIAHAYERTPA